MNNTSTTGSGTTCSPQVTITFILQTTILTFCSLAAIISNFICLHTILKSGGALPLNVKTWITSCNITFFIRSFYFLAKSVYYILIISSDFSTMRISLLWCLFTEYFNISALWVSHLFLLLISFDRLWSTLHRNKLKAEAAKCNHAWHGVTVIWTIATAFFIAISYYSNGDGQLNRQLCYCHTIILWSLPATIYTTLYTIVIQLITLAIYVWVFGKNKTLVGQFNLNTAQHNLAERFAMWSNVNATKWLIPINVFHCSISVGLMIMVNMGRVFFGDKLSTGYVNYATAYTNVFAVEALIHPMMSIRFSPSLMKITNELYPKLIEIPLIKHCFYDREMFLTKVQHIALDNQHRKDRDDQPANRTGSSPSAKNAASLYHPTCDLTPGSDPPTISQATVVAIGGIWAVPAAAQKNHGRKTIVEYRLNPDQQHDLLDKMWSVSNNDRKRC